MRLTVLLPDIRSVHNVGSMFRTADAVGVERMYLTGITPVPVDRFGKVRQDFAKVSLGAEASVPWEYSKSAIRVLSRLRKEGWTIVAVEQSKESVPYDRISVPSGKACLVMGNEVTGLPKSVLKKADIIGEIPMRGQKESLNVGVAFGIVAFGLGRLGGGAKG